MSEDDEARHSKGFPWYKTIIAVLTAAGVAVAIYALNRGPGTEGPHCSNDSRIVALHSDEQGAIMPEQGNAEVGTSANPLRGGLDGVDIDVTVATCGRYSWQLFDQDYDPPGDYTKIKGGRLERIANETIVDDSVGQGDGSGVRTYRIVLVEITNDCKRLMEQKERERNIHFTEDELTDNCRFADRSVPFAINHSAPSSAPER